MDDLVHVAGARVRLAGRCRQRCSWCGTVLIDEVIEPERAWGIADGRMCSIGEGVLLPMATAGGQGCWGLDPAVTGELGKRL